MKKRYYDAWRIIVRHWDTLLLFQILYGMLYQVLGGAVRIILAMALKSSRLTYLNQENFLEILFNPAAVLLIIATVFLFGCYLYFGCLTLYTYYKISKSDQKLTLRHLLAAAFGEFRSRSLGFHVPLLLYMVVFVPVLGMPFHTLYTGAIQIPEFITEFLSHTEVLKWLYYGFQVLLFIAFIVLIFAPYEMFVQGESWKAACKKSAGTVRRHFWKIAGSVVLCNLFAMLLCYAAFMGIVLLMALYIKISHMDISFFWFSLKRLSAVYRLIQPVVGICVNFSLILALSRTGMDREQSGISPVKRGRFFRKAVKVAAVLWFLTLAVEFIDSTVYERFGAAKMDIIAHRAGGMFAPENTIAGLNEAVRSNSNYAEIDVQLTADGVLVLSHDVSLARIAKVDKNISDLTYEQLCGYDAGQYFGTQFKGEKFPTLAEALDASKGKIRLMIELKSGNNDRELVEKTLEMVYSRQMAQDCIIASMNIELLRMTRTLDSTVQTAYIMAFAYGDLTKLDTQIDIYAVEPTYISRQMLNAFQAENKKVFVWTVNKEKNLAKAVRLPIDGIITDNPYLAQYVMETNGIDPLILEILKWL